MLDETQAWYISGDGKDVASGDEHHMGYIVHARCLDRETAEHIVRLHNEARFRTRTVIVNMGTIQRPQFGDTPAHLRISTSDPHD